MSTPETSTLTTGSTELPTLKRKLFVAMQHVLPQHFLTSIVYSLTRSRATAVKNWLIRSFVRSFKPDMADAAEPNPLAYGSFNEFFTRALRPDARPFVRDERTCISPVDGTVSQLGRIDGMQLLQAKGRHYSLDALLAGANAWNASFKGGSFATLYLAPHNYHRIHMPLDGTLVGAWYVPGKLFSVNATTAAAVDNLFARNERVVCVFENGPLVFALVLVGALFVGSMQTVWHGEITPRRPRRPLQLPLTHLRAPTRLAQGDEMGRFNMGSTVILLLPPGAAQWLPDLRATTPIRMGQPLARLTVP
ncbi:MAG TPA: archaetidylserine decarboxylase [Steroidobacteraceae bacterium]|nr:archaetidylserine decarboxylase [Steroidobacteraceae bacterium]